MSAANAIDDTELDRRARSARGRLLLQIWLSPAFPVGGFAYSHGMEKAVELGWIHDHSTLEAWLGDLLAFGGLHNDLIVLAASWRAAAAANKSASDEVAALAIALQPSSERRLETSQQGRSFLQHVMASWVDRPADPMMLGPDQVIAYPVAVGYAAGLYGIPLGDTLQAFAVATAGALTSAGIRLNVIGQTGGQRILAALLDRLHAAADTAVTSSLADLGGAAWRSDIASMQHETQTTRLFRS